MPGRLPHVLHRRSPDPRRPDSGRQRNQGTPLVCRQRLHRRQTNQNGPYLRQAEPSATRCSLLLLHQLWYANSQVARGTAPLAESKRWHLYRTQRLTGRRHPPIAVRFHQSARRDLLAPNQWSRPAHPATTSSRRVSQLGSVQAAQPKEEKTNGQLSPVRSIARILIRVTLFQSNLPVEERGSGR